MHVTLRYGAPSGVDVRGRGARVRLSGSTEREGLSFRGVVRRAIPMREALAALYDTAVADFRWRPPESRNEFRRWLAYRLDREREERAALDANRRSFLRFVFDGERGDGDLLDPVCTVHPDQVFLEAFSRDGSAYARLGLDRGGFEEQGEVRLGTTNVDFSSGLYQSVRRLRSIWRTEVALGAEGLEVETKGRAHREKRIDLPDGWVRGFVQLSAASLLDGVQVEVLPIHVFDLCRTLRLRRARTSPRALRFELTPGAPAEIVLEPWEHRVRLSGSTHDAAERRIIRVWGRRRLRLLERMLPFASGFSFRLLGRGLPYFVTARGPGLDFTLGLSGWTRSDWSQTAGFAARLARLGGRARVSDRPLAWLERERMGTTPQIAAATNLTGDVALRSLVEASARGVVVFDALHRVWRHRPLFAEPLPASAALGQGPEELEARALVSRGAVRITGTRAELGGRVRVQGHVQTDGKRAVEPAVELGERGEVRSAACGCFFAKQHGLKQGLCAHTHALLILYDA